MPDKRVAHAAERIPLPRKVRERAPLKRETLSISQRRTINTPANVPAIGGRALESDPNGSHNDNPYDIGSHF